MQSLEAMQQTISTEVTAVKQETTSMQEWKDTMDHASTQAASVLEHLQDQFKEIRCLLLSVYASVSDLMMYVVMFHKLCGCSC